MGRSAGTVEILSIFEANSVNGPLRPLVVLGSARQQDASCGGQFQHAIVTTGRTGSLDAPGVRDLRQAVHGAGLGLHILEERFAFDPRVLRALRQLLEQRRPDVVETHNFKSHLLFYLLRKRQREFARLPWIAFHHGYTQTSWRVLLYQELDRLTLRAADHVVTFCQPFAAQVASRGVASARVSVISNTYMPRARAADAEIAALRAEMGADAQTRVILCVGRLSTEKGQRHLLQAVRALRATVTRLRVALVGEGPDLAALRAEFADIWDVVAPLGYRPDPWPFYAAADVVAIPSLSEGSPLVLFEAMAAGRPIVASQVGGIPEVLENGQSGMLVPAADPQRLAAALTQVLGNPSLAQNLGLGAARSARDYAPDRYGARLRGVYDRVLHAA